VTGRANPTCKNLTPDIPMALFFSIAVLNIKNIKTVIQRIQNVKYAFLLKDKSISNIWNNYPFQRSSVTWNNSIKLSQLDINQKQQYI